MQILTSSVQKQSHKKEYVYTIRQGTKSRRHTLILRQYTYCIRNFVKQ